jgi:hypothetical protein
MEEVLIVGIVFFSFYKIIELFVRMSERKRMIDKISQISPELLQSNINSLQSTQINNLKGNPFLPLRLGAVAIGAGIGWIFGILIKLNLYGCEGLNYYDGESAMIATTALCAGIALFIVYFIERKAVKEGKKEE